MSLLAADVSDGVAQCLDAHVVHQHVQLAERVQRLAHRGGRKRLIRGVARDGDGDGYADIWRSEVDAMTSIANYFVNAGWRRGEEWGFAVNVPAALNRGKLGSRMSPPRCPRVFGRHSQWRTIAEWRQLGISPQSGSWPKDGMMATLLEPDGVGKTGYLLGGNYRVILDYNCSNFYALSVGLLADQLRN